MPAPDRPTITSTRNPLVQRCRAAAAGDDPAVLLAEGVRLVQEGLDAGAPARLAVVSSRLREPALRERLDQVAEELVECSDAVLARASGLDTHQGVAVVFARPQWTDADLLRRRACASREEGGAALVLAAAGVRDPGNLGALLRSSEAAGATGVLTQRGGADPFRDKAVRGSMGSVFRLPVQHGRDAAGLLAFARAHGLQVVVADGHGEVDHTRADLRGPVLLVLGAEAAGIAPELRAGADVRARIPLQAPVESLNVAVAAGVLLFEARRQRG
ncbi:MAG: TrmH family RNA methyltransferase [Planctomycetota bacterium]